MDKRTRFVQIIPSTTGGANGTVITLIALDTQGDVWNGRIKYESHAIEWTMFKSDRK